MKIFRRIVGWSALLSGLAALGYALYISKVGLIFLGLFGGVILFFIWMFLISWGFGDN